MVSKDPRDATCLYVSDVSIGLELSVAPVGLGNARNLRRMEEYNG